MGLFTTAPVSIFPATQASAGSVKFRTAQVQANTKDADEGQSFNLLAQSDTDLQSQIDTIMAALRSTLPFPDTIAVKDTTGNLIAWIGQPPASNPDLAAAWFESLDLGGTITAPAIEINRSGQIIWSSPPFSTTITALGVTVTDSVDSTVMQASFFSVSKGATVVAELSESGGAGELVLQDSVTFATVTMTPVSWTLPGTTIVNSFVSGDRLSFDDTNFLVISNAAANFSQVTPTNIVISVGAASLTITPTTSATAASGAATLPTNPVGFLTMKIGATNRKFPFYA